MFIAVLSTVMVVENFEANTINIHYPVNMVHHSNVSLVVIEDVSVDDMVVHLLLDANVYIHEDHHDDVLLVVVYVINCNVVAFVDIDYLHIPNVIYLQKNFNVIFLVTKVVVVVVRIDVHDKGYLVLNTSKDNVSISTFDLEGSIHLFDEGIIEEEAGTVVSYNVNQDENVASFYITNANVIHIVFSTVLHH